MSNFKQIGALLRMGLADIPHRLGAAAVSVIGIVCVVGVLISMLSLGAGLRTGAMRQVRDDRVTAWSQGSMANASRHSKSVVLTLSDLPGIKRDAGGKAIAAANSSVFITGRRKRDGSRVNALLDGVTAQYFSVYPELKLTHGRMFQPGLHEVIVGKAQYDGMKDLEIGQSIRFQGSDWIIVGRYEAGRNLDNRIMTDADTLMAATSRSEYTEFTALLESPASFATLQAAIKANPLLNVDLKHEKEVMTQVGNSLSKIFDYAAYVIGTVMAIGATLGAINALYAVIDGRRRQLATLCAIGFGGFPIVASVLLEAMLLAVPAALIATALAWLLFNGDTVTPMGLSIKLAVTPTLALAGICWALLMGAIGGLWPALRAARVPVTTALRAT